MTLIERAERAIAELDAHRITHNLHAELADLVRAFHAEATAPTPAPLTIAVPNKGEQPEGI